jgi:hypothetical protein
MEENIGAAGVSLTASDVRQLDEATSKLELHGARYPEHLQKWDDLEAVQTQSS